MDQFTNVQKSLTSDMREYPDNDDDAKGTYMQNEEKQRNGSTSNGKVKRRIRPHTRCSKNACDFCAIRRIRCEEYRPCKQCTSRDIACTNKRPLKKVKMLYGREFWRMQDNVKRLHYETHFGTMECMPFCNLIPVSCYEDIKMSEELGLQKPKDPLSVNEDEDHSYKMKTDFILNFEDMSNELKSIHNQHGSDYDNDNKNYTPSSTALQRQEEVIHLPSTYGQISWNDPTFTSLIPESVLQNRLIQDQCGILFFDRSYVLLQEEGGNVYSPFL